MIKYVVYWVLSTSICTEPKPSVDEFGRVSNFVPSICIVETTSFDKQKYFENKSDALEFYQRAKEQEKEAGYFQMYEGVISDARLDSVPAWYTIKATTQSEIK